MRTVQWIWRNSEKLGICYGKYVFLVSLYFVYLHSIYMLLCACTSHVNRLGLCIFTGCYAYLPKIHV